MRKPFFYLLVLFVLTSCSKPKQFNEASLQERLIQLDGQELVFKDVIEKHKGKKILIDFWASWCADCIKTLPQLRVLQKENPRISYVFISLDRDQERWKRAIHNYQIQGDHYFMSAAKKGPMDDFLNLWWIPRYLVVDENSEIVLFKSKKITDQKIQEALEKQ